MNKILISKRIHSRLRSSEKSLETVDDPMVSNTHCQTSAVSSSEQRSASNVFSQTKRPNGKPDGTGKMPKWFRTSKYIVENIM